ncbi:MAG: hypothetical protein AAGF85_02150 [Bacteroidota bacterium]
MSFKSKLYTLLDIQESEATKVFLLLGMGFFMGIFLATLDVGASTLFLNNLEGEQLEQQLPLAILTAGVLGIIFTFLYNVLQGRIRFVTLAIGSMVIITAVLVGIEWGLRSFENLGQLYFFAFTFLVPANFIVLLIFWGAFGRMFNLRQSKRIIGSIDTGQLVASILALFSIPVVLNYVETSDLLFISLLSMGGLLATFLVIVRKDLFVQGIQSGSSRIKYIDIFRNKYIALMAIFVTVSMIAVNFVDYSFLNVVKLQFDEKSLPNFLSLFEGTVVIFSFLFQTFVTDRIIAIYGLKVSLLINPILIGFFTALAIPIGFTFGYSIESSSLVFFFVIIAMSKLFNASLKDALDGPAFKLYFLPVESHLKFDVQTKIEGVVTAFAGLIAGSLLILIQNIEGLSLIYISIFTLPLFFLWYYVTTRMHNNYRLTLKSSLVKNKAKLESDNNRELSNDRILTNQVESDNEAKVIYGLKIMEKLEPGLFESSIKEFMNSDSKKVREFANHWSNRLDLEFERTSEISRLAKAAAEDASDSDIISVDPRRLEKLSQSTGSDDRILAAKLLRRVTGEKNIFLLLELLRDIDPRVKKEAIITARKLKVKETWGVLIDFLASSNFSNEAAAALIEAGKSALFTLETAFHKSGQSDLVMLKIVQIMGKIGGDEALDLLWNKIEYPDGRIIKHILLSLRYYDYRAADKRKTNIVNILENEIGKAIWNMAAVEEFPNVKHFVYLRNALKDEVENNFDMIYMLLSILYDPQSVQLVRENAESGTADGSAYAIELLDLFLDQDLKPKLFPLVDDIDVEEKLRQLQIHFPRESYTEIQALNYILNRNYNQANRWTKACALHSIAFMPDFRISRGLVAQLFNQDEMIQEAAAWVVYHKDSEAFNSVASRLKPERRKELEASIEKNSLEEGLKDGFYLGIEMIMFMKRVPELRNVKGAMLADMVDHMKNVNLSKDEGISLPASESEEYLVIVADGKVRLTDSQNGSTDLLKTDVFGSIFQTSDIKIATRIDAISDCVVFLLPVADFYTIMADHHELTQQFVKNVSKKIAKTIN